MAFSVEPHQSSQINKGSNMATSTKKKMGRPTRYSHELAEKICDLIRSGKSERQICAMKGMPSIQTLWVWKEKHPEFLEQSARARADSADFYNDRRKTS